MLKKKKKSWVQWYSFVIPANRKVKMSRSLGLIVQRLKLSLLKFQVIEASASKKEEKMVDNAWGITPGMPSHHHMHIHASYTCTYMYTLNARFHSLSTGLHLSQVQWCTSVVWEVWGKRIALSLGLQSQPGILSSVCLKIKSKKKNLPHLCFSYFKVRKN